MAVVQQTDKSAVSCKGLHLHRGDISNCSMRARISLQKSEEPQEFHSRHAGGAELKDEDLSRSREILADCFGKLDAALDGNDWTMGDRFTLADISRIPVFFVPTGCGHPFDGHRNITRWAKSFNDGKSYRDGILEWCHVFSKP